MYKAFVTYKLQKLSVYYLNQIGSTDLNSSTLYLLFIQFYYFYIMLCKVREYPDLIWGGGINTTVEQDQLIHKII